MASKQKPKGSRGLRIRQRDDGTYAVQAVFQRPDPDDPSKRITKSQTFDTVRAAEDWLAAERAKFAKNPSAHKKQAKATFGELVELWRETNASDLRTRTVARYEGVLTLHLLPEFKDVPVVAITRARVRTWLAARNAETKTVQDAAGNAVVERRYAVTTIRKFRTVLSAVLAEGVERELIETNPCHSMRRSRQARDKPVQREMVALAPAEVIALANAITPHYRLAVLTAGFAGLRASELWALRARDIDLENATLHVRQAIDHWEDREPVFGSLKTEKSRRDIELPAELVELLRAHLAYHPGGDALVFRNERGKPVHHDAFRRVHFYPARNAALPEHPALRWHDLRHSYVSTLVADPTVTIKEASEAAGHSSTQMTLDTYTHRQTKKSGIGAALSRAWQAGETAAQSGNVVTVDFGTKAS
jgi:integrase